MCNFYRKWSPLTFWDLLYIRPQGLSNGNQILHGDQTRREEIFLHGRPRQLPWRVVSLL